MNLTKRAIKRLQAEPKIVQIFNGYFNRVTVTASFSQYSLELTVDVTHPLLEKFGAFNEVSLMYWTNRDGGFRIGIPEELNPLVDEMRLMGKMSDEKAQSLLESMEESIRAFSKEFFYF